jgi:hypothetical protein
MENLIMWYAIIGILYCFINGAIRKLDTNGDFLLPMFWIFGWPMALGMLGYSAVKNYFVKHSN